MKAEDHTRQQDDQFLTRYLLGALPENEAEPLDALSISDDAFALRLLTIENELVDLYARGELSSETRTRFEAFYLSSPVRREKAAFARSLYQHERARATAMKPAVPAPGQLTIPNNPPTKYFSLVSVFPVLGLQLQWGLAFAALLLAVAAGYFAVQNQVLRRQVSAQGQSRQDEQQLQTQLDEQGAAIAKAQTELARMRASLSVAQTLPIPAILLLPQTRGTGAPVNVAVPSGIATLPLRLDLETDEFGRYRAILKDPANNKTVWTSAELTAEHAKKNKTVSVELPGRLLQERNYLLELTGLSAKDPPVPLSTYMFHVALR
jgi:hypothetical protein